MDHAHAGYASLSRRLLSLIYETLLLTAVVIGGGFVFTAAAAAIGSAPPRIVLQSWLLFVSGAYFVWHWVRGGQTLPMRTWRLRIVTTESAPLTWRLAALRFVLACAGTLLAGCGFFWALIDPDRQFLHDRIVGTRIISNRRTT